MAICLYKLNKIKQIICIFFQTGYEVIFLKDLFYSVLSNVFHS